jgi:hypothetical protein
LLPRWLFWPLFAAVMGFALGGSFVAAFDQPNQNAHAATANPNTNQRQPPKAFGKRLSIIWDRTWDDPVAFYTFVLGIFTALLVGVSSSQGYFLFRTDRTARESAEAAKIAAEAAKLQTDAFIAVESSIFDFAGFKLVEYLYPDGLDGREVAGRDPARTPPVPEFLRALIAVTNLGKAPLRLAGMCVEYGVGKTLPPDPFYLSLYGVNSIVERGETSVWFMQPAIFQLDQDQRKAIDAGTAFLWVYGFFSYIGLLKETRNLGFVARWDTQAGAFTLQGPSAYSYDREIPRQGSPSLSAPHGPRS